MEICEVDLFGWGGGSYRGILNKACIKLNYLTQVSCCTAWCETRSVGLRLGNYKIHYHWSSCFYPFLLVFVCSTFMASVVKSFCKYFPKASRDTVWTSLLCEGLRLRVGELRSCCCSCCSCWSCGCCCCWCRCWIRWRSFRTRGGRTRNYHYGRYAHLRKI